MKPTLIATRIPRETRTPRMDALARLPVFLALEGRRALVAGGTPAAAWKVELLSAAGARVDVYAPEPSGELLTLAQEAAPGAITLHRRAWEPGDIAGAAIAVGACADDGEAARFAAAARASGVAVNVIDKPRFCDFSFGAIVNRSPLVIGISTDGAAPVFAQAIRAKLEALIPRGFSAWAEAARRWRAAVRGSGLSFNARRRFWQLFTAHAVRHPGEAPVQADFDRLLAATREEGDAPENGSVALVGAGPGDPELLTLRALRALQSADVILYDDLVAAEVLDFARREAKKMLVGKTGHGPSCKQSDINALMVGLARAGKRVVRLKGGDPMIFGRAGEEIAACVAANIAVEVVPGISAAQGAAARLGVSLTHRSAARRVQFITGHGADGKLPHDLDWRALADPAATTAIYMPAGSLGEFVASAVAHGLDPQTSAVLVARATQPDETVLAAPIAELPQRLAAASLPGPMIVMIGAVFAGLAGSSSLAPHISADPETHAIEH
jgi:uroporphyrin-III C-methyltransferase / precorrin-2 dehydrogenase / sirohydrochlorin ferrochelatase